MRFKSLSIKGLVPFPDLQTLTFPEERCVAVTGENGAGKTTLLDCIPMALYGAAPNRSGFYGMFRGNDALIDFEWEMHGHTYRIKRLINANSRTQKPWFFVDGQTLTEGKSAEFDAAVAKHLGISEQGFLASVYHSQSGKGNPLTLDDKGRRELLSEVLGLNRFDEPYALATAEAQKVDRFVDGLWMQIEGLQNTNLDRAEVDTLLARAYASRDSLAGTIAGIDTALQDARQQVANAKANAQGVDELKRKASQLSDQLGQDQAAAAGLEAKIQKNETDLLGKADEIRAAVFRSNDLKAEVVSLNVKRETALQTIATYQQNHRKQVEALQEIASEKLAKVQACSKEAIKAGSERTTAQREADSLAQQIANLKAQAGLLGDVPCQGTELQPACKLLASANQASASLPELEQRLAALNAELPNLESALKMRQMEEEEAQKDYTSHQELLRTQQQDDPSKPYREEAERYAVSIQSAQLLINTLEPLLKNAPYLEGVEERLQGYRDDLARLQANITNAQTELAELNRKIAEASDLMATVAKYEAETRRLEDERRTAQAGYDSALAQIGQAQAKMEQAQAVEAKVEELKAQIDAKRDRLATAELLRQALGPKGARALKIDSAGPEIGELVNTLLRECYGQRFTIVIKTLRELTSKDGEFRECLDFGIIDNTTGEEGIVEDKSGGEKALIKEVISLGLCIYQRRRSGIDTRTLIRDECSAPLSEVNTDLYIQMLRKACEIGGFEQVLYVSHKSSAQAMADATIHVANGKVTVK